MEKWGAGGRRTGYKFALQGLGERGDRFRYVGVFVCYFFRMIRFFFFWPSPNFDPSGDRLPASSDRQRDCGRVRVLNGKSTRPV